MRIITAEELCLEATGICHAGCIIIVRFRNRKDSKMRKKSILLSILMVFCFAGVTLAIESPKAGPRFKNLRYDEDFSYLGGTEGSYVKDPWDSIKWIPIGNDWHLTLGGQARLRFESETNKDFGSAEPSHDSFLLQRYFLHADLRHESGLRFFLQGKFAHVNNRDKGGKNGLEAHADIQQVFVDVPLGSATWRLGRQELQYGKQRLISPLDWGNLRRTFQGVKVFGQTPDWRWDAFAVRPVKNDRRNLSDADEQIDFYGLYTTWKGTKALAADFYALLLKNNNDTGATNTNANSRAGRRTIYTVGNRLYGKRGSWDYETEAAAQFGTYAGDRVRAWMATAGAGYTFADAAWKPRIGLLYDYASGDRDSTDGTHSTFNQLFPLGHAYFGYLDRVGRQNVHAIKAQLKVKPTKKLTVWADFHTFFADQSRDSMYGANGAALRGDGTAGSHNFGHELDLTMKYALNKHTTVLAGWAHFWTGGFIERSSAAGASEDADFLYAQIEYKF